MHVLSFLLGKCSKYSLLFQSLLTNSLFIRDFFLRSIFLASTSPHSWLVNHIYMYCSFLLGNSNVSYKVCPDRLSSSENSFHIYKNYSLLLGKCYNFSPIVSRQILFIRDSFLRSILLPSTSPLSQLVNHF